MFSCLLKSCRVLLPLRGICLFVLLFLSVTVWAEGDNSELVTVVAIGHGENKTYALENATEEALRKCTGTLLLSREELTNDSLRKTVIQASRGSIKKTEILSSETQEDGLTVLTIKVRIDTKAIIAIVTPEIKSEGANVRLYKIPLLNKGLNVLYNFFKSLNLLNFMEVSLDGTPAVNVNALKIAVQLTVREDAFQRVPIPIYITNILFFSLWGGSLNTPWYVVNGTCPSLTVSSATA